MEEERRRLVTKDDALCHVLFCVRKAELRG